MRLELYSTAFAAILSFTGTVKAKAVFAHYLVCYSYLSANLVTTNCPNYQVGTITEDHAHKDIDDAIAMG